MIIPFKHYHILNILNKYDKQNIAISIFLSKYFRENKAIGSKDRKFISNTIYGIVRWKGLLDYLCTSEKNNENRLEIFLKINIKDYIHDESIPPHIRVSFPKSYFKLIEDCYGQKKALDICSISNEKAPVTIRCNALKTSHEELYNKLQEKYRVSKCTKAKNGMIFHTPMNFYIMEEYKNGLFEIQDEGSQLISSYVKAKPNEKVLDFCSGSGGKTLAFGPDMQNKGIIYLYDIRENILKEAKKRLKRANIQNYQFLKIDDKKLYNKMDWVLVDVPCSGSGTLRRNPDMKWKFSIKNLQNTIQIQKDIFKKAIKYLKPDGIIVYSTCSILEQENQNQLKYFLENYPVTIEEEPFKSLPEKNGMDGFFCVSLKASFSKNT
jgi:16S rRNA (cytosine967-C5)-methyltransferase